MARGKYSKKRSALQSIKEQHATDNDKHRGGNVKTPTTQFAAGGESLAEQHGKAVQIGKAATEQDAASDHNAHVNQKTRKRPWSWELVFAGVVAAFTVVQGFTSYLQWKATNDQYSAMILDQRPWVNVRSISIETLEPGKYLCVKVTLENAGRTPAIITSMGCMPWLVDNPEVFFGTMKKRNHNFEPQPHMKRAIGPGTTSNTFVYSPKPMTAEGLAAIESGKQTLFVIGELVYADQAKVDRHTNWCFAYAADDKRMIPSEYGNDLD